jgi:hypothetical protein
MIGITIAIIILLALLIACIGIWNINTDTSIDYDLYGMDAEEYLKKQVGEEYYIKYYKE